MLPPLTSFEQPPFVRLIHNLTTALRLQREVYEVASEYLHRIQGKARSWYWPVACVVAAARTGGINLTWRDLKAALPTFNTARALNIYIKLCKKLKLKIPPISIQQRLQETVNRFQTPIDKKEMVYLAEQVTKTLQQAVVLRPITNALLAAALAIAFEAMTLNTPPNELLFIFGHHHKLMARTYRELELLLTAFVMKLPWSNYREGVRDICYYKDTLENMDALLKFPRIELPEDLDIRDALRIVMASLHEDDQPHSTTGEGQGEDEHDDDDSDQHLPEINLEDNVEGTEMTEEEERLFWINMRELDGLDDISGRAN